MTATEIQTAYRLARRAYAALGVDTDRAMQAALRVPVSVHCWQADDVRGFEPTNESLTSGGLMRLGRRVNPKAFLYALLEPVQQMRRLENAGTIGGETGGVGAIENAAVWRRLGHAVWARRRAGRRGMDAPSGGV